MKNVMVIAICTALIGFTSCSSDDDGGADVCTQKADALSKAAQALSAANPLSGEYEEKCEQYNAAAKDFNDAGCTQDGKKIEIKDCTIDTQQPSPGDDDDDDNTPIILPGL